MIFYADGEGTIFKAYPTQVYQGSAEANRVIFVAPFATSNMVNAYFQLPHGVYAGPYLMTNKGLLMNNDVPVELDGAVLNTWELKVPSAVTQYAGVVKAQFFALYNSNEENEEDRHNEVIATSQTSFTVQKGIPAGLPSAPTDDAYTLIMEQLSYIISTQSEHEGKAQNGEYPARSIKEWGSYFTYGIGEYVIHLDTLYYSDTAPGNAEPGKETADPPHWREVFSFDTGNEWGAEIEPLKARVTQNEEDIDTLQAQYKTAVQDTNKLWVRITDGEQVGADSIRTPGVASTVVMYSGRYYFFRRGTENYIMRAKVSDIFTEPWTSDGGIDETKWEVVYNLGEITDTVIDAVKEFIDQISGSSFEIVSKNPDTGYPDVESPSKNIIYLTPKEDGATGDSYDEWIYTNNKWERIGSTEIDLSAYVTKTELSSTLASYVTQTLLTQTLQNYITSTVLTQTLTNYATKQYVDEAVSSAGVKQNEVIHRAVVSPSEESADFYEDSGALYYKNGQFTEKITVNNIGTFTFYDNTMPGKSATTVGDRMFVKSGNKVYEIFEDSTYEEFYMYPETSYTCMCGSDDSLYFFSKTDSFVSVLNIKTMSYEKKDLNYSSVSTINAICYGDGNMYLLSGSGSAYKIITYYLATNTFNTGKDVITSGEYWYGTNIVYDNGYVYYMRRTGVNNAVTLATRLMRLNVADNSKSNVYTLYSEYYDKTKTGFALGVLHNVVYIFGESSVDKQLSLQYRYYSQKYIWASDKGKLSNSLINGSFNCVCLSTSNNIFVLGGQYYASATSSNVSNRNDFVVFTDGSYTYTYERIGAYNDDVKSIKLSLSNNKLGGTITLNSNDTIQIPEIDLTSMGYDLPQATNTALGGVKMPSAASGQTEKAGITSDGYPVTKPIVKPDGVNVTLSGKNLNVEVELDNNTSVSGQADLTALTETPVATTSAVGGIKAQSGSSDGQNFPVQVNSDGTAFINIPIYNGEVE